MTYADFLSKKQDLGADSGFAPLWIPDQMFDFQKRFLEWALRKGRACGMLDCGLGKTFIELAWAENVLRHTNKPVLLLTPLAVGPQTITEGEKFGIAAHQSKDGTGIYGIVVSNYQRLHYFNPHDFSGCVLDESSILKNADGRTKNAITEFMRVIPYRLLCTATAAPNDYMELGTSSECLGYMGHQDIISRFFTQKELSETTMRTADGSKLIAGWGRKQRESYRLRGHAERDFWRFICSWARACRKPSDLGGDDAPFKLPELIINEHVVQARTLREGWLYEAPAVTVQEQKQDLSRTLQERCEKAAELVANHKGSSVMWCHLNAESSLLAKLAPNCVEVSGSTDKDDDRNEEAFLAFSRGQIENLVTKPSMGGFGLNWQHCHHQTNFPSHSFEQFYQAIRRSLRFGQQHAVTADIITTEGQRGVRDNMMRKSKQMDQLFDKVVSLMHDQLEIDHNREFTQKEVLPSWLLQTK